jgi:hypothetical protein
MCECLRFEPSILNKKINTLAPRIVIRSTLFPNKKINKDNVMACVNTALKENTIPSKGCVLKTVMGVKLVAEW